MTRDELIEAAGAVRTRDDALRLADLVLADCLAECEELVEVQCHICLGSGKNTRNSCDECDGIGSWTRPRTAAEIAEAVRSKMGEHRS